MVSGKSDFEDFGDFLTFPAHVESLHEVQISGLE